MVLEIATRWQAAVNTEHLLRMAFCWAETRREERKKIVRVSWETLCYLHSGRGFASKWAPLFLQYVNEK